MATGGSRAGECPGLALGASLTRNEPARVVGVGLPPDRTPQMGGGRAARARVRACGPACGIAAAELGVRGIAGGRPHQSHSCRATSAGSLFLRGHSKGAQGEAVYRTATGGQNRGTYGIFSITNMDIKRMTMIFEIRAI